jgi:hypothetical protein
MLPQRFDHRVDTIADHPADVIDVPRQERQDATSAVEVVAWFEGRSPVAADVLGH